MEWIKTDKKGKRIWVTWLLVKTNNNNGTFHQSEIYRGFFFFFLFFKRVEVAKYHKMEDEQYKRWRVGKWEDSDRKEKPHTETYSMIHWNLCSGLFPDSPDDLQTQTNLWNVS